jgi:MerR family transcriptional regulator, light-induced transcriptional regulator
MEHQDRSGPEQTFRVGAVARMTGLTPDTIRVWERRYQAVEPERSPSGSRLYRREDISRLALLKRLVDAGDRIGGLARLALRDLQARLDAHAAQRSVATGARAAGLCRVAVLGDALPARVGEQGGAHTGIEFVVVYWDRGRFEAEAPEQAPDLLALEYPTVDESTRDDVDALMRLTGARRAVVVYGFGSRRAARRLDDGPVASLRAPVGMAELRHTIQILHGMPAAVPVPVAGKGELDDGDAVPPRRFRPEEIGRIAAMSPAVECECPRHLADLIAGLGAFERYSEECESRYPPDAELHGYLHRQSGRCRAMLEEALVRVLRAEGIEV